MVRIHPRSLEVTLIRHGVIRLARKMFPLTCIYGGTADTLVLETSTVKGVEVQILLDALTSADEQCPRAYQFASCCLSTKWNRKSSHRNRAKLENAVVYGIGRHARLKP